MGSGGAGKSTLARALGRLTGFPVIRLDQLFWSAGWVADPKDEFIANVETELQGESWIMDGNYSGCLDLRLRACDTVVVLEVPREICLYRVVKRAIAGIGKTRMDMAAGCPERFSWEFFKWVWNYPSRSKLAIDQEIAATAADKSVHRLRTRADVQRFLMLAKTAHATA